LAAYNYYGGEKEIKVYPYNNHEGGGTFHTLEKIKFIAEKAAVAAVNQIIEHP